MISEKSSNGGVSIRSPYRSKGRSLVTGAVAHTVGFQSAPLTEARGDGGRGASVTAHTGFNPLPLPKQGEIPPTFFPSGRCRCFNPLPLPKQGEIPVLGYIPVDAPVSIRSPYRSKGRCGREGEHRRSQDVSIRSPYRSKGRYGDILDVSFSSMFQSAPLTEARGDAEFVHEDHQE